jgi:hypothetical protein
MYFKIASKLLNDVVSDSSKIICFVKFFLTKSTMYLVLSLINNQFLPQLIKLPN